MQVVTERYTGVKVFSATKFQDRDVLGDKIGEWIARNPTLEIVSTTVTQSSDDEFHCLAITIFFRK